MLKKRQKEIITKLNQEKEITVSELSELYKVSLVTIRRDLEILEEQGYLLRTHGGAILLDEKRFGYEFSYSSRRTQNLKEKELIAKEAVKLIDDNEVILIDAGTTTSQISKFIQEKENLVLITNSLYAAIEIGNKKGIGVFLLGGSLNYNTLSTVGNLAIESLKKFHSKKLFLGAGGISIDYGITYFDMMENDLRKIMIEQSDIKIVLADHTKFERVATASVCPIKDIDYLITDNKAPKDMLDKIVELGVKLIIAED